MKHLKNFEKHVDDIVEKDYISPDELRKQLNSTLKISNFEAATKLLRGIKNDYPYIKNRLPYKDIYNTFLKKWNEKFKVELGLYKPEKTKNEAVDYTVENDFVSIDELREQLEAALRISDFEASTKLIRSIKAEHPYVKTTSPYKELYTKYINRWHEKFKNDVNYYMAEK